MKILIRTQDGRLINQDYVSAILPDNAGIRALVNTTKFEQLDTRIFHGRGRQMAKWMQAYQREFECAGNLPTYIIDVNKEAEEFE